MSSSQDRNVFQPRQNVFSSQDRNVFEVHLPRRFSAVLSKSDAGVSLLAFARILGVLPQLITELRSGVEHLPPSPTQVHYRGVNRQICVSNVGDVECFASFTSLSTNREVAKAFSDGVCVYEMHGLCHFDNHVRGAARGSNGAR